MFIYLKKEKNPKKPSNILRSLTMCLRITLPLNEYVYIQLPRLSLQRNDQKASVKAISTDAPQMHPFPTEFRFLIQRGYKKNVPTKKKNI